jgi:hypothetical protein
MTNRKTEDADIPIRCYWRREETGPHIKICHHVRQVPCPIATLKHNSGSKQESKTAQLKRLYILALFESLFALGFENGPEAGIREDFLS